MSDSTATIAAPATTASARGNRKERIGEVISNKMAKTITVRVERRFAHARFKKVVTGYKKFYAHDEKGEAKVKKRVRFQKRNAGVSSKSSRKAAASHLWLLDNGTRKTQHALCYKFAQFSTWLTTPAPSALPPSVFWAETSVTPASAMSSKPTSR